MIPKRVGVFALSAGSFNLAALTLACTSAAATGQGCVTEGLSSDSAQAMTAACLEARDRFTGLTGYHAADVRLRFGDTVAMRADLERSGVVLRFPTPAAMATMATHLDGSRSFFGRAVSLTLTNIARRRARGGIAARLRQQHAPIDSACGGVRGILDDGVWSLPWRLRPDVSGGHTDGPPQADARRELPDGHDVGGAGHRAARARC